MMEESKKTFFGLNTGVTFPSGRYKQVRPGEEEADPGMQAGFGSFSYMFGFSAGRKVVGPNARECDARNAHWTLRAW